MQLFIISRKWNEEKHLEAFPKHRDLKNDGLDTSLKHTFVTYVECLVNYDI